MITYLEALDDTPRAKIDAMRNEAVARFLAKRDNASIASADDTAKVALLNSLYRQGRLWLKTSPTSSAPKLDVYYVPSAIAIETLGDTDGRWAQALGSKVRKSIRTTEGAIFSFPEEDGNRSLEVFITDWSPCPAACALAIHRLHPFVAGQSDLPLTGSSFTGRFVRHALTGDLLPVWIADWVKADFGTGAVLVNPGHNAVDLAFGRQVGLPIRFALVPDGTSDEPDSWPIPPVVKTGTVVRSGPYDGLSLSEAQKTYLDVLTRRGLARLDVDRSLGSAPIASITISDSGAHSILCNGAFIGTEVQLAQHRGDVTFSRILSCAASAKTNDVQTIVASALMMKTVGPALAGLLVDVGLSPDAADLKIVGPAESGSNEMSDEVLKIALLVSGKITEAANVNQQIVDQVTSFLRNAERCLNDLSGGDSTPPNEVDAALSQGDPKTAFRSFARWQKDCLNENRKIDGARFRQIYDCFVAP